MKYIQMLRDMAYPSSLFTISPPRGYAALTATIIVCTVVTSLALQAGTATYLARASALESEYAAISRGNAYSCLQIALFELSADIQYRPQDTGDNVTLTHGESCVIVSVIQEGDVITLVTQGNHRNSYTRLMLSAREKRGSSPPFEILDLIKI